jgi:hypothetical protein
VVETASKWCAVAGFGISNLKSMVLIPKILFARQMVGY